MLYHTQARVNPKHIKKLYEVEDLIENIVKPLEKSRFSSQPQIAIGTNIDMEDTIETPLFAKTGDKYFVLPVMKVMPGPKLLVKSVYET